MLAIDFLPVSLLNEEEQGIVKNKLINYAIDIGVENGFIQEGETASESFIPEFNDEGV